MCIIHCEVPSAASTLVKQPEIRESCEFGARDASNGVITKIWKQIEEKWQQEERVRGEKGGKHHCHVDLSWIR